MSDRLLIIVCSSFAPEIKAVVEQKNLRDVSVQSFHANCVAFPYSHDEIANIATKSGEEFSKTVFIGSSCITSSAPKRDAGSDLKIVHLNQCFDFLLNAATIESLIMQGAYLVSNGWLRDLPYHIRSWGFDPETAKKFFAESARKIILLDTGLAGDYKPQLAELSEYTGLPVEILPIGMDYCTLRIETLIQEWRAECMHRDITRRLAEVTSRSANYTMVFEQMKNLVDSVEEDEVARNLHSTLTMLFAPKEVRYEARGGDPTAGDPTAENDVSSQPHDLEPLQTDSDLQIFLRHGEVLLGIMHVREIAFPQYISRYKDISRLIGRVGGLAIANARKFQTINEKEQQLRLIANELRSVISTKDLFFNIIAHDLRSPLNGVLGLTSMMADGSIDLDDTEEIKSISVEMHASILHLHSLIENLLAWAQAQRGSLNISRKQLNLRQLITKAVEPLKETAAQKHITLSVNLLHEYTLHSDERMLETVFRNLVSNSIKFTPLGGRVSIETTGELGDTVMVAIRDTGIGMSPEQLEKLFRIETKTNRAGTAGESGTGLGLLLCKEFIDHLGGNIEVGSEVGVGTTFTITLEANSYEPDPVAGS